VAYQIATTPMTLSDHEVRFCCLKLVPMCLMSEVYIHWPNPLPRK